MENISNGLMWDDCTKCPNCDKQSWHIYKCKCGEYFCIKCSIADDCKENDDTIELICKNCGNNILIIDY